MCSVALLLCFRLLFYICAFLVFSVFAFVSDSLIGFSLSSSEVVLPGQEVKSSVNAISPLQEDVTGCFLFFIVTFIVLSGASKVLQTIHSKLVDYETTFLG